jgi:hypothetical protein
VNIKLDAILFFGKKITVKYRMARGIAPPSSMCGRLGRKGGTDAFGGEVCWRKLASKPNLGGGAVGRPEPTKPKGLQLHELVGD